MNRLTGLIAAAAFAASLGSASAATIPITLNVSNGNSGFWTYSTSFNLPTGFTSPVLQITTFEVDDRAVLSLNGNAIASTGVFGPGNGTMTFVSGGPNDPYTFLYGSRIGFTAFAPVKTGFVAGSNALDFVINNTGAGIFGVPSDGGGPTDFQFNATVTYSVAAGVPEPATWAMMLIGFAGLAFAARRRERLAPASA
jgi:hypothetical protein